MSEFFPHERQFLRVLLSAGYRPEIIYDIGASTGIWSETIATVLPEAAYELFEPLATHPLYGPHHQDRTQRLSRFRVHPVAFGDKNSEEQMCVTPDAYGSSLLDRGAIPEISERIPIQVFRLDDFASQNKLPAPNVIKIDCQGAEAAIIRGGFNTVSCADVLFLETWLQRGYGPQTPLLAEIIQQLRPLFFTIVDIGEKFFDDRHRLYSVDAFFCSERLLKDFRLPFP